MNRTGLLFFVAAATLAAARPENIPFTGTVVDAKPPADPWYKMAGDIDGDGQVDVVIGGRQGPLVWYRYPDWTRTEIAPGGWSGVNGETGDVDGDGDVDIVMGGVVWFVNPRLGGGTWEKRTVARFKAHDIELGDFDRDGKLDIAARDQSAFGGGGNEIRVYRQDGPMRWSGCVLPCPPGEGLKAVDLDGDGDLDLAIGTRWYERVGDITKPSGWMERTVTTSYAHPHLKVDAGDFNGDGRTDIVVSPAEKAGSRYRVSWFEAPADPRSGAWTEHRIDGSIETVCHALGAGDMDGDGDVDVVVAEMHQGENPDEVVVYRNEGDGISWSRQVLSGNGSHDLVLADFGGDGDLDVLGANWSGKHQPVELWVNGTKR